MPLSFDQFNPDQLRQIVMLDRMQNGFSGFCGDITNHYEVERYLQGIPGIADQLQWDVHVHVVNVDNLCRELSEDRERLGREVKTCGQDEECWSKLASRVRRWDRRARRCPRDKPLRAEFNKMFARDLLGRT